MVFIMTSGCEDMEDWWHAARVATDIVTMGHALEVGELALAGVPQYSRASAQHEGHAHHTTNCNHMGSHDHIPQSGSQLTILMKCCMGMQDKVEGCAVVWLTFYIHTASFLSYCSHQTAKMGCCCAKSTCSLAQHSQD